MPTRSSSVKGKEKAVEPETAPDDARQKGKRVRAHKQAVPVEDIMKGGNAPWQQECVSVSPSFAPLSRPDRAPLAMQDGSLPR